MAAWRRARHPSEIVARATICVAYDARVRRLHLVVSFAVLSMLASPRHTAALELPFDATLTLDLLANPAAPPFVGDRTGVAEVALEQGGAIQRIDFPGQVFETTAAQVPLTDPNMTPISGIQVTFGNDAGVFQRGLDGFGGPMPLHGRARICLFGECEAAGMNIEVPLSVIGRDATATATAGAGGINLTVVGAPWTTGSISVVSAPNGIPRIVSGSDQGAKLNLVTPIFVSTSIGSYPSLRPYARLVMLFSDATGDHCTNGIDDDGDGSADFPADPGCDSAEDPSERNPGAPCDDGLDNDGDFRIDSTDLGCEGPLDGSERSATLVCDDGFDNDGDEVIDFPSDPGCANSTDTSEKGTIACDDGVDSDGDALVDLLDPGCTGASDTSERGPGLVCDDGVDDDLDGTADFPDDLGCASIDDPSERSAAYTCDNGLDDDGDTRVDHPSDPGCASASDASERAPSLPCDDALDNDFDGTSDFPDDPGCAHPSDTSEQSPVLVCDNGLDDDGDALIDSQQDPGCDAPGDPREAFDFTDGAAHQIDLAHPSPDNAVFVGSDTDGAASALQLGVGGALAGSVSVAGDSYLQMKGGTIGGNLVAADEARVSIRGGAIGGQLEAGGTSLIEIIGTSFDLPFGEVLASSGTLVGLLLDGTAISVPFTRATGATIRLVPEADVSLAAVVGFGALLGVRTLRSRRRGTA